MTFDQIKVAVSSHSFAQNQTLVEELLRHFPATTFTNKTLRSEKDLADFYQGAEAILVGKEIITDHVLKANPQIKVLSKYGVGLDNLNQELLENAGISLLHSAGVNRNCVAELTLGMILNLAHKISELSNLLREGKWFREGGFDLANKTVGILGFGNVGTRLAEILVPFNVKILVVDIVDRKEICEKIGACQVELDEMLFQSQIVSLHVPLTDLTKNLVNASFIEKMRPSSLLINTSRGKVLCLEALEGALKSGKLAGAAVDVYPLEPPGLLEIMKMPNLITTPHIGGASEDARLSMGSAAINNLLNFYRS